MSNIINLAQWLKSKDVMELKNYEHAYKLRKVEEDRTFAEAFRDAPSLQLEGQPEALNLIALDQAGGT
jgi:hypothetical protein